MLDLEQSDSQDILTVCNKIEKLSRSYAELYNSPKEEIEQIYEKHKVTLGIIGVYAEKHIPDKKIDRTNQIIQLLYKPLTGQVKIKNEDKTRIDTLIQELENECFPCWTI